MYNSVKSSKVEIDKVKDALALKCMINETETINVGLIAKCIKNLKGGKSDGSIGFSSDYIINGGNRLYVHLSFMFQPMLIHGFTPDVILKSTIISIPKNA